jgi:hypothetical protein
MISVVASSMTIWDGFDRTMVVYWWCDPEVFDFFGVLKGTGSAKFDQSHDCERAGALAPTSSLSSRRALCFEGR